MSKFGNRSQKNNDKNKGCDFYPTPKHATQAILERVKLLEPILEPCNGMGDMSDVIKEQYKNVKTFDIHPEAIADEHIDFLTYDGPKFGSIMTNPPFAGNYNGEFIRKSLENVEMGGVVVFLLKLTYIESKKRKQFFEEFPPKFIYVHSTRLNFYGGVGVCYAWYVWEKGFKGDTILKII